MEIDLPMTDGEDVTGHDGAPARGRRLLSKLSEDAAQAHFAAIVQSSNDAIISKSLDGTITSWNPAAEQMFGYTADEAIGQSITLIIPPERRAEQQEVLRRLSRGERIEHFETIRRARDGRLLDISLTISPIRNARGAIIGASKISRDITERKRAEAAVRESEQRFRMLADAAPVLIWMSGPNKEGIYFNQPWLDFTGVPLEAQHGNGWLQCVHPDDAEGLAQACHTAFNQRQVFTAQFRLRRADGVYRWMLDTGAPRFTAEGEFLGFIGSCVDISESKRAQAAVEEGERRLNLALHAGRMGAWEWNIARQAITWSPALEEIHGLPPGGFGGTFADFQADIHPDDRERVLATIQRTLETRTPYEIQYRIIRPDGHVAWLEARGELLLDDSGHPQRFTGVCADITARKRTEEALHARVTQQRAIAELGQIALTEAALPRLLQRAVALTAETLGVEYCKVLELLPDGTHLLLRAGVGWQEGLVGAAVVDTGHDSQAGYTLQSEQPVIVQDLRSETRFNKPPLLYQHDVRSGMSCVIPGPGGQPWGVLGAHSKRRQQFTTEDVNFLRAVAHLLSSAVQRIQAEQLTRAGEEQLRLMADAMPALVSIMNRDFVYQFVNRSYAAWFKQPQEWFVGKHIHEVLGPETAAIIEPRLQEALGGQAVRYEATLPYERAGSRYVEAHYIPDRDEQGRVRNIFVMVHDLTARRQAELALRESEGRAHARAQELQAVMDSVPAMIFLAADPACARVSGSRQAYELLRTHPDDNLSMTAPAGERARHFRVLRDGQPVSGEQMPLQRAARGELVAGDELEVRFSDNTSRYLYGNATPLRDRDGNLRGAVAALVDVTQRREMEQALRESEQRFRTLADNMAQFAWMADASGWIFWYNRRWFDYTGTTLEQMQGWGWRQVHHPDHVEAVTDKFRRHIEAGVVWEDTFPLRGADGRYRWFLSRALPIRNEQGAVLRWFGTNTDVTEQREIEQALRESEARFRNMADNAPVMIWVTDATGACTYLNRQWFEFTGQTPEEFGGYTWLEAIHPEDAPAVKHASEQAVVDKQTFRLEYRLRQRDGEYRWVLDSATPRFAPDGPFLGFIGSLIDITDRKRDEDRLRFMMAELNHRVKNTLATVEATALQTIRHTSTLREFGLAFRARLQALAGVHSLLTKRQWEGTYLHDLIQSELAPRLGSPAQLVLEGPQVMLRPRAALPLHMVVHELCTNAAKYGALSSENGQVRLRWQITSVKGDPILTMEWLESGGPEVTPPARRGFGSEVLEDVISYELEGSVQVEYRPTGLRCTLEIPWTEAVGHVTVGPGAS